MPKKTPRNNPPNPERRTILTSATVLRRLGRRGAVEAPVVASATPAGSLLARLQAGLPEALQAHLLEALEKPGELVLFADSAAWAGRIRLAIAESPLPGGRKVIIKLMPAGGFRK